MNKFKRAASNLSKQQYKIWQDEYHPVALISEKWITEKMNYIHNNPIRTGFVETAEHWKYSSARNRIAGDDTLIKIDKGLIM